MERGDKVIASARSLDKIQDLPRTENIRIQQLDVTDGAEAIQQKIDEAVTFFGRIDVLVNNAGSGVYSILEEGGWVSLYRSVLWRILLSFCDRSAQLRRQYDINVFGQLDVTSAVLKHMRPRRSGTIVMIGSRTSWHPVTVRELDYDRFSPSCAILTLLVISALVGDCISTSTKFEQLM